MNFADLTLIFLIAFSGLAFFDGIVLHLWKYKLYAHMDTLYEHRLHTIRATLFPMILIGLFLFDLRGPMFVGVIVLALIDLVVQGFDMWEEKKARSRFGGLSSLEYILHVVLTSLHTSMLLLYVLSKPIEAFNSMETQVLAVTSYQYFITMNLLPGAVIVALLHWILMHSYFRKPSGEELPSSQAT